MKIAFTFQLIRVIDFPWRGPLIGGHGGGGGGRLLGALLKVQWMRQRRAAGASDFGSLAAAAVKSTAAPVKSSRLEIRPDARWVASVSLQMHLLSLLLSHSRGSWTLARELKSLLEQPKILCLSDARHDN